MIQPYQSNCIYKITVSISCLPFSSLVFSVDLHREKVEVVFIFSTLVCLIRVSLCLSATFLCREKNAGILPSLEDLLFYTIAEGEETIPVHKFLTVSRLNLKHQGVSWPVTVSCTLFPYGGCFYKILFVVGA